MTAGSPYDALQSESGRALLESLVGFDEEQAAAAASRARALAPPGVAAAALATTFARRRAAASEKFERPEVMLFTRAGYEQASSSAVARHRSERFAGLAAVCDLCCGIGSDSVALARVAENVLAVDLDADALACLAGNARALGVEARIRLERNDALATSLVGASAAFADPSRRLGATRVKDGGAYRPPLTALMARAREIPDARLCVKVAPGLDVGASQLREAIDGASIEAEFVSERGVCKEAVLWCGAFARADGARRATVIDRAGVHVLDGDPAINPPLGPLGACVGEPDPAVIRAGLIGAACAGQSAAVLDRRVAYVTASSPPPGPFVRWYRVRDAMPFAVKKLRAYLRERNIGELVVKTRAFPIRPDEVRMLLKPSGAERAVLICATIGEKKTAIVCEGL